MTKKQEDIIRHSFEMWAVSGSRFYPVDKAIDGSYFNVLTNEAWKAYKRGAMDFNDTRM